MKVFPRLLLSLLFVAAMPASATDFAGSSLVIPIVGRTAGALGSRWQTDVYVTNVARRGTAQMVTLVVGQNTTTVTLEPRATVVLKDFSLGTGMLRIVAASADATITARARIYNTASAQGEYGQTVPAMPIGKLGRDTYLPGLSGTGGNRTNIGIANPNDTDAEVFLMLFEPSGEARGGFSTVVPRQSVRQINDVFTEFGAGIFDGATIQVTSSVGVYAYASIVRSDSGDADFVAGTGVALDPSSAIVTPPCTNPAAMTLAPMPARGWIVVFKPGTNARDTTTALAATYHFSPITVYEFAFPGFHAELTPSTIASLRCEASVLRVEQNGQVIP